MITLNEQPNRLSSGYNLLPVRLTTSETELDNYEFMVNLVDREVNITNFETVVFNRQIATRLTVASTSGYKRGDEILINDVANADAYSGYYFILDIIDGFNLIINLEPTIPYGVNVSKMLKVFRWTLPAPGGTNKIDIAKVVQSNLKSNVEDSTNNITQGRQFSAPHTTYKYKLIIGDIRQDTRWNFTRISNGRGFDPDWSNRVVLRSPHEPSFLIGDRVNLDIDPYIWSYNDNQFSAGGVAYTGSTRHWLRVGQSINVQGQITYPSYNGPNRVNAVLNTQTIRTFTKWIDSTPIEGGFITYELRPEWNTDFIIEDIIESGGEWVILTNIRILSDDPLFDQTSLFITAGGKVISQLPDINPIEVITDDKWVYSVNVRDREYFDNFGFNYIINDNLPLRRFSSIIDKPYTISKDALSYLLVHIDPLLPQNFITRFIYSCYDVNNNLMGTISLNTVNKGNDYYIPCGINNIVGSTTTTGTIDFDKIKRYTIQGVKSDSTPRTALIEFEIADCSKYKEYNLIWKDAAGSYLSKPFGLINRKATEVETNKYYQDHTFDKNLYDRGETVINTEYNDYWKLTSDYLNDEDNYIFKDLLTSNEHYLHVDGEVIAVTLETNSIEYGESDYDGVFNYQFIVKSSKKIKTL